MKIRRNGLHLFAHPATPARMTDLLSPLLAGRRTHFNIASQHVIGNREDEPFWSTTIRKPNVGLATAMALLAESNGQQLIISESPEIAKPQPVAAPPTLFPWHRALVDFVRRHDVGMLIAPTEPLRLWLLSQVIWLHAGQRFVLLARSRREVLAAEQQLLGHNIQCAVHLPGVSPLLRGDTPPSVTVTTFVGAADIDFATADFAILLDGDDIARDDAQRALEQVDARFRIYGLSAPGEQVPPRMVDLLMAVFGPFRFDIDARHYIRRDVGLLRVRLPLAGESDRLRDLIWQNRRRNDFIAELAARIALGHPLKGRAGKQIARWPGYRPDTPLAVVVLVQTADHAVQLRPRLPGWPIYGAQQICRIGLTRGQRRWLEGPQPGDTVGYGCVALPEGLEDLIRAGWVPDVLIYASGVASSRLVPDACLFARPDLARPLMIVDINDVAHPTAEAWSHLRLADFAARDIYDYRYAAATGRTLEWMRKRMRGAA